MILEVPVLEIRPSVAFNESREIWAPTDGAVAVDIGMADWPPANELVHLRVGDWATPPLDVMVDAISGALIALQVWVEGVRIANGQAPTARLVTAGIPVFDVGRVNDGFVDRRVSLRFEKTLDDSLLVHSACSAVDQRINVAPGLAFFLSSDHFVVALEISHLTQADWALLQSNYPQPGKLKRLTLGRQLARNDVGEPASGHIAASRRVCARTTRS